MWRGESDIDEDTTKHAISTQKIIHIERESTQQQEEDTHTIKRIETTIEDLLASVNTLLKQTIRSVDNQHIK